ncbi:MAG: mechanosensitive ion channel family protein [Lachnospiraceae bacterium]|nr:mechanosensitive ion channel family protein [Lachnospiraceae bacterium]MBQ6857174.1 mechanosensitive ion channel family protein [Lachnospiraceae bacterium]
MTESATVENVTEVVKTVTAPGFFDKMMDAAAEWITGAGFRILVVALILIIGLKVIKKIRKILDRSMEKAGVETTLRRFVNALANVLMMGLLIFIAAEELGISVTSLVAVVGSVGLALSLAMEKSLANFAGGVMVLLLKPFKAGDFISTPDGDGVVDSIGLVYTTLVTADNQRINIPNSNMTSNVVTNVTGVEKRKVVLNIGISYNADLKKAKEVLRRLFENHEGIISEDGIDVIVDSLGESSVNLSARGWVLTGNYWTTRWDLLEQIKLTFDEEGIEIPYNYLNVNVVK